MTRVIFSIIASLLTAASWAAVDFRFRHYTVDDGLPSSTVRAIVQDRMGFMWFGSDNGLCRYDGVSINRYCYNDDSNEQYVSCLHDDGTHLWIGTYNGIYLYNFAENSFSHFDRKTKAGDAINGNILTIASDKEGNVWIAVANNGVYRYSPKSQRLDRYPMKGINGRVSYLIIDDDNQVWASTNWALPALWKLDKARNQFVAQSPKGVDPNILGSIAMTQDASGNIWIGTWSSGLVKIDGSGVGEHNPDFRPQHIHHIMEYAPYQLLIGSDDGLSLYNTKTDLWRTFVDDETIPFSLSNRFVYPIVNDREGGVWIGTFYGGINYIVPNANKFAAFSPSKLRNSLGGNVVNRFCEDRNGNVWIASDDGGLSMVNPKTDVFTNFTPANSNLSYHNVHALCADGDDLWIGTYTGGINRMSISTGKIVHYQLPINGNTANASSCYSIFKDSRGRLWATSMESIYRFDYTSDQFRFVKNIDVLTIDIDEDHLGNIFFSTQGKGVFIYENATGKLSSLRQGSEESSLPSDQVNATLIDGNGNCMIATQKGLCQYNYRSHSVSRIKLDIPSNNIYGIVEDNGNYWLATDDGLVKYSNGEPLQRYTKDDGLQSDQSLPNAMLKASNGRIYIGSQNGFSAFYPYEIAVNKTKPSIHIIGFEVTNKPKEELAEYLRDIVIGIAREIELPHDANSIAINFASLSYCAPSKNQYEYRLDGLDNDWVSSNGRTRAVYTNLSPGTYTFRVKGTNNDGVWSSDEATLKIVINPPFYLSLPMKIVYLLAFIAAIFFGYRYMLCLSNRKHEREIRHIKRAQEQEIREAKIKFFTMIAHEIRTPVSLIIAPLENIMRSPSNIPAKLRTDMDVIDRNAHRLLYLVNQLLDFRKVQTDSFVTHFKQCNIKQLLEAVTERFEPTFKQKGISFAVTYPSDDFAAVVDPEAITKVVSNLLTNANKYTRDQVRLECFASSNTDAFTIVVADNGMGVKEEDQQRIFQPFYQAPDNKPGTGIGLSIVKSIVDQHKGKIGVTSIYGEGSTFTVSLPVSQPDIALDTLEEDNNKISDEKVKGENVDETNSTINNSTSAAGGLIQHSKLKIQNSLPTMLIVEDNEDMRNFIASNFKDKYKVITANDGIEGLEQLRRHEVTLILSDWMMPNMDGVTFCRRVRSDRNVSHIPLILLTAKTDDESKAQGMECGADIYIEKPFSMQVLKSSIANMIELRRMLREKFSKEPSQPIAEISNNPIDTSLLTDMQKIIEENLANQDLNVNFLAERLNISRSALFSKIKTLADVTPNEMIQVIRLKAAARMIAEENIPVAEAAYRVGFSSPSYFSKCFQKQFGKKPIEFRA